MSKRILASESKFNLPSKRNYFLSGTEELFQHLTAANDPVLEAGVEVVLQLRLPGLQLLLREGETKERFTGKFPQL